MHRRKLVGQLGLSARIRATRRQVRIRTRTLLSAIVFPFVGGSRGRIQELSTLFFHLHRPHTANCLFALDALLFASLEYLFVFDA
jgi:hypothetical protein